MNLLTALITGILASFTPCVIVLIPTLIYRFSSEKKPLIPILKFSTSFLAVYVVAALFLSEVLTSNFRYGLQIGLGILFITMGVLALMKRFNPLQFKLIKNTWLFGAVFALIVSVNPCVFAYLGILISISQTGMLPLTMTIFASGVLIPALAVAIFGNKLLRTVNKASKVMHYISQSMNVLLIGIGLYLLYTVKQISTKDIYLAAIILVITLLIVLRSFFILNTSKVFRPHYIILLIAMVVIMSTAIFTCNAYLSQVSSSGLNASYICSEPGIDCAPCLRCVGLFLTGTILGFIGVLVANWYDKRQHQQ